MAVTNLPPLRPTRELRFEQLWQWVGSDDQPHNLAGWTAEIVFTRNTERLLTLPLGTSDDGEVTLTIPPSELESISGPSVRYEITLRDGGVATEVWRGTINVE